MTQKRCKTATSPSYTTRALTKPGHSYSKSNNTTTCQLIATSFFATCPIGSCQFEPCYDLETRFANILVALLLLFRSDHHTASSTNLPFPKFFSQDFTESSNSASHSHIAESNIADVNDGETAIISKRQTSKSVRDRLPSIIGWITESNVFQTLVEVCSENDQQDICMAILQGNRLIFTRITLVTHHRPWFHSVR